MDKETHGDNTVIYTFSNKDELLSQFATIQNIVDDAKDTLGSKNIYNTCAIYTTRGRNDELHYLITFGPHDSDCIQILSIFGKIEQLIKKIKNYWEEKGTDRIAERLINTQEFIKLVYNKVDLEKCCPLLEAANIFMDGLSLYIDENEIFNKLEEEDRKTVMDFLDDGLLSYDENVSNDYMYEPKTANTPVYFSGRMGDIFACTQNTGMHGELYKKEDTYIIEVVATPAEANTCMEWLNPWNESISNLEHIGKI